MTKRLLFPNIWAEGGTATDPDLDTTNPNFEADKYAKYGWKSQKPPEEWQNFLSQISDAKIVAMMFDGIPEKDASVTYPDGAVYKVSGTVNVVVGGVAKPIVEIKSAEFLAIVADLQKKITNHLAADNPHNDTVNTLVDKSYVKTDVDNFFGSATDPRTIVYHKARRGAAIHGETPAQVGTLPNSGGTFTGPVVIEKNATVNISPSKLLHLNGSTGLFELASGTVSLGIDGAGNCWIVTTAGMFQVMTEANYNDFEISWNSKFALPVPFLKMDLSYSISDASSIGQWKVSTSGVPSFNSFGGINISSNILSFTGFDIQTPTTIYVVARNSANKNIYSVFDKPSASYTTLSSLLSDAGLTSTAVYIQQIICYPTLSAYQKSMLVK